MDSRRQIRSRSESTDDLLPPLYRETASKFVSAWIDNAPHERHDSREVGRENKKTRSFGLASGKNGPQSGPLSGMYFENDIFLNSQHRTMRESWEPDTRKSLSTVTASDDTYDREKAEFPTRFRPAAATLGAVPSVISIDDTPASFQRAKREAFGPSQIASKSPRGPNKSTQANKRSSTATPNDTPDHDLLRREREIFLRDRALFVRERELFLDEKQRFYSDKDVLLHLREKSSNKKTAHIIAGRPKSSDTVQT